MHHHKKKENNKPPSKVFFQKKPQRSSLHDLQQLQAACDYLKSSNPSADSQRKQMRGVQLAQQLVDPNIQSVQTILAVLELKKQQLLAGQNLPESGVNEMEDSSRRYPLEYQTSDYDRAWMHYVDSLLHIPMEDSIIETDVYNYKDTANDNKNLPVVSHASLEQPTTQEVIVRPENLPEPSPENLPAIPKRGLISRIFRRNKK